MTAVLPLAELQQKFSAWLREPDDDRARALAATLQVGPAIVVYQNNYRVSLVEALRETHKRCAAWLGDDAFAAAAAHHIDAHPPSDWTIDAYGSTFHATLRELWRDDPEVAELAMIDRAVGDAFVTADAVPIDASGLAGVDWDYAAIRPVPSLRLLSLRSNADALWLALAAGEPVPAVTISDAPGTVMVWRQGFEPVMRRADVTETLMVERSMAGASFAQICDEMASSGDPAEAVTSAGTVLGRWLGEALVAGFA
ncbi:putative DNA-binding domain-containing protein [Novosphingobium sp.]|uniref:HvfC/BufC family peptide modification chaperone n=1 Tax=Novosphingobium sp. TaxID=1874826 RepID=UPI003340C78A